MSRNSHGLSGTPTYSTWCGMLQRCYNPNSSAYKWYGAKGITVCKEWREDFVSFFQDMGERPSEMTLDRIDSSKGYFKENCRWTTMLEQQNNRTNTSWRNEFELPDQKTSINIHIFDNLELQYERKKNI